jgi:N-acetylneuraminic acid mutarotase
MREADLLALATAAIVLAGSCGSTRGGPPLSQSPRAWEWRQAAASGGSPVWFAAAFTIGTSAYVGTGYDLTTAFWRYDPGGDSWTRRADFGGAARGAAVAFSVGEHGYLGLGFGSPDVRFTDLWEYDPSVDHWTAKAPIPAAARDHAAAFVIGQRAYVVGGMTCEGSSCVALKEVWEYEPQADRWTQKADIPEETTAPACFVLNGIGYVGTGTVGALSSLTLSRNLWAYDPQADTWTRKADLPGAARYRAVGFSMNGRGYIGTGLQSVTETSAVVFGDVWEYDPQTDAWTLKPDFTGPARGAAVSFTLGTRVFVGTGVGSGRQLLRDFWRTVPAAP